MGKSGGVRCAIKSCRIRKNDCPKHYNRPIRFFRFPNPKHIHESQIDRWKLSCNDDTIMKTDNEKLYSNMRICSLHFEQNMMKKCGLQKYAVPTLNLEKSPVPSATFLYEEHSYCKDLRVSSGTLLYEEHLYIRDENLEVGHFIEIDVCPVATQIVDCPVATQIVDCPVPIQIDDCPVPTEIVNCSVPTKIVYCSFPDNRKKVTSRDIGTQTDRNMVNMGSQTHYIDKSDCQIQTEKRLLGLTPRKSKVVKKLKDQKVNTKVTKREKVKLQILYDEQVFQIEEI